VALHNIEVSAVLPELVVKVMQALQ